MRTSFASIFRLVASVLLMTVLTSGIAMAAYICPKAAAPATPEMVEGMPCAGMDVEKPVQCAKAQAGEDLALEQMASAPSLTPTTFTSVMPAAAPAVPPVLAALGFPASPDPGSDPPYLRTLRLRI